MTSSRMTRLLLVLALGFVAPPIAFGWSTYSTGYGDSSGYIHGVGVTDVTTSIYCCHTAYATTTLTSPTGQHITTQNSAHNAVTADLSSYGLSGNLTDGDWTVGTSHTATCATMGTFIAGVLSSILIHVGHSENWYKFAYHNTILDLCIYTPLVPGCVATCQGTGEELLPPCSNGSDSKAYVFEKYYYYKVGTSTTKHCFFGGIPGQTSATPGTCKDVG